MNTVVLMGRLTRNPEIRYSQGQKPIAIARYTLAVNRRFAREEETKVDFIPCVVFGKNAEFTEKYLHQGNKIVIRGRIQTGSYTNRDGKKVFTTEVVVEEQNFAESGSKVNTANNKSREASTVATTMPMNEAGFMSIPEGFDEELPFM